MKKTNKIKVEEFIRVDHAGERGAIKIYEGQLLALNTFVKNDKLKKTIEEMKEHEKEHCDYFENEIKIRNIKPTKLLPLWDLLGVGLGSAVSATSVVASESGKLAGNGVVSVDGWVSVGGELMGGGRGTATGSIVFGSAACGVGSETGSRLTSCTSVLLGGAGSGTGAGLGFSNRPIPSTSACWRAISAAARRGRLTKHLPGNE